MEKIRNKTKNLEKPQYPKQPQQIVQIDIFPKQVIFQDIQLHQHYQIPLHIRNTTREVLKIRVIHPQCSQFKLKYQQKNRFIAPGLSFKVSIIFSPGTNDLLKFEDSITLLGDNFKKVIPLVALRIHQQIQYPQIFKVDNLKVGKQYMFEIPIKNVGKVDTNLKLQSSKQSTNIEFYPKQFFLPIGKTTKIQLRLKSKKVGTISDTILLAGKNKSIKIKGLFIDEQLDIVDKFGQSLKIKDLGEIIIGQEIQQPFYIINNSSTPLQCLFKIFNRSIGELSDLKIDEKRLNFISKLNPQAYAKDSRDMNSKLMIEKFSINKFSDYENKIIFHRKPTIKDLQKFAKTLYSKKQQSQIFQSCEEVLQMLVGKITGEQKLIKIPIKFIPLIPKITISRNYIQFKRTLQKNSQIQQLTISNLGNKALQFSIEKCSNFIIEEIQTILHPRQNKVFKIKFHPVIKGKYSDLIKINILNCWPLQIKVCGICVPNLFASSSTHKKLYATSASFNSLTKFDRSDKYNTNRLFKNIDNTFNSELCKVNKFMEDLSPTLREPFCQIMTIKSQLTLKQENLKQKTNKTSHPLQLRQIIKLSQSLTNVQLQKVVISNNIIDFNNIFIKSQSKKLLSIKNLNSKPIMFELDLSKYQTTITTNKVAKFKIMQNSQQVIQIAYKPDTLGFLKLPIIYIINNQHIFQINIIANVTLVNLELSQKNLNFSFKENQLVFEKSQELVVKNYGNTATKFTIIQPENKQFIISKKTGQLEAYSSMNLKITYRPKQGSDSGQQRIDNAKFYMKVHGGAQNIIKCTGIVNQAKCMIKQSQLLFPEVFISYLTQGKFVIKNISKVLTVVSIQTSPSLNDYLQVDSSIFSLDSQQKKQVCFSFFCNEVKKISGFILIKIRGSKIFKIPFEANIVYPCIEVTPSIIDFGSLPILSNYCQETITLKNLNKSEIRLQFTKNIQDSYQLQINAMKQDSLELQYCQKDERIKFSQSINLAPRQSNRQKNDRINENVFNKVVKLLPNVQSQFFLKFIPKNIQKYNFNIPLKMFGTLSTVEPIKQTIKCNAVQPLIYIIPQQIDFETKILCQKRTLFTKNIKIINPHNNEVKWKMQTSQLCYYNGIQLESNEGIINPKGQTQVVVMFRPKTQGIFQQKFKVYLNDKSMSYFQIKVKGMAVLPTIAFSCNQAIMPVVPLGVQSKKIIKIQNNGYETVTICKWKTSNQFQFVDLKVNFLDGKLLSLTKKTLKIQISFISLVAISFTTILQFYDDFGNKYELPLSATADNCALTIYPYLQLQNQHNVILDMQDNSLKLVNCRNSHDQSFIVSGLTNSSCSFILKWINYELNFGANSFPEDLIESNGQGFMKLVNRISGKILLKAQQKTASDKVNKIQTLYEYYSASIRILKTEGAFLNHIRPEYLLNINDYLILATQKNMVINEEEFDFKYISITSWIALFYQLCKLYVLPQISEKNMQKLMKIQNIPSSAIYSNYQILIFKYLNTNVFNDNIWAFSEPTKVIQVLQNILQRNFSAHCTQQLNSLKISMAILAPHQFLPLMSNFLYTQLRQFGLSLFLQPNDLFVMNHKQFVLYFISLINMMIQYSTYQQINFQASIGQKITKTLEFENPSNKKIRYWMKIVGSSNFQCSNTQEITLQGKQKSQIPISYHCKASKQQEAKLYFIPSKEQDVLIPAQPLIFHLKTTIISKVTVRKINLSACLYQIVPIILDVQLPIQMSNTQRQFTLTIKQQQQKQSNEYYLPSIFCNQNYCRLIKQNRDRLQLKIVSLSMQKKHYKIIYHSLTLGEYIYELIVNIEYPAVLRQIKLKNFKINREELFSLMINKDNEQLQNAYKFLIDNSVKVKRNFVNTKFQAIIAESQFIKTLNSYVQVQKCTDGRQAIKLELVANFNRPFKQYTCVLILKHEPSKDIRVYRLSTVVTTLPKVINLIFKTPARQDIVQKLPLKLTPCNVSYSTECPAFNIENFESQLLTPSEFHLVFSPKWVLQSQASITIENKQTLQQIIYIIKLSSIQPLPQDCLTLNVSEFFETICKIPLKFQRPESLIIKSLIKRKHVIKQQLHPQQNLIMRILPDNEDQSTILKFCKKKSEEYYWIKINLKNKIVKDIGYYSLNQKINSIKRLEFDKIDASADDFKYHMDYNPYVNVEFNTDSNGQKKFTLVYTPYKQINQRIFIYFQSHRQQYRAQLHLQSLPNSLIILPELTANNLQIKSTTINLINSSPISGFYRVQIEGSNCFTVQNRQLQIKAKQKVQIKINFQPKFINQTEKATLKFISNELPDYHYSLNGFSHFQIIQSEVTLQSFQGNQVETIVKFSNNFSKKQIFTVDIQSQYPCFQLVNKETSFELKSQEIKVLRITNKKICNEHFSVGKLIIKIGEKVFCIYKIKLYIIKNYSENIYTWHCKCRQSLFESLKLNNNFILTDIEAVPQIKKFISFNIDNSQSTNQIKLKFAPMKPFLKKVYNIILQSQNIKYRIKCQIHVEQPDFDDIIHVRTSNINQIGLVSFKLTNVIKQSAKFKAYFEKNNQQLLVQPSTGYLQPYGRTGTLINVKFCCNINNKKLEDKLIIQTSQMYWKFKVKAQLSRK